MQAALGQWQQERREFHRDLEHRERDLLRRREGTGEGAEIHAEHQGKVVEVGKAGRRRRDESRFGKVIEVAPAEEERPKSHLESELEKAEERAEAIRRRKREDPEGFAREKAERERIAEGHRAWEQAVEERFKERQLKIEEEARRMQAELDAARRREELLQAKKLGGTLDAEGNFVDSDLREEK
ncbi:MAG: hypothetical protein HYZ28_14800 [Myxococcales bacterium]|nr:hypothetical protein [Myxococcales bacterium]